jgi:hypothetical protein
MSILKDFSKHLDSIEFPSEKTSWNIAGVIKGQNGFYKFDVRNMFQLNPKEKAQNGKVNSKADKMVLDIKNQYIIIDLEELHKYLKQNGLKKVYVDDLISNLDWNIILPKN